MSREILKLKIHKQKLPVKKKVAAYARVSSKKESMIHSLSAQISYYSKLIQDNPDWQHAEFMQMKPKPVQNLKGLNLKDF